MSVSCCLIFCVLDGSMNFPKNSQVNVSQSNRVASWGFPAFALFVCKVSQCAFHDMAFESLLMQASTHTMKTSSLGKSVGCRVWYV